ncbi:MAG: DUF6702 family protein [Flavisolibacter sp.]
MQWFFILASWMLAGFFPESPSPIKSIHPFYISVTEINHNAKDKTLEISCKMFAEDLEVQLEKNYRTTLDISSEKDKASFDKYIPDYLGQHFSLSVDGKPVKLVYVGFEKEKESAYCYFQVNGVSSVKKIDLVNSLLYDFNDQQINIMHVTVNGQRQSTKLNYPDKQVSLSF